MSDKIVKSESEVGGGAAGLLERALDEKPAVEPSAPLLLPKSEAIFRFLEGLDKRLLKRVVLRTSNGVGYGSVVQEVMFRQRSKLETLTTTANYFLAVAQADCDDREREVRYILIAYSDSGVLGELSLSLSPTPPKLDAIISTERDDGQGPDSFSILGEAMRNSPAFQALIAKRIAFDQLRLGPGESATVTKQTQIYFCGEKLLCSVRRSNSDTTEVGGVYLDNIFIGQKPQRSGGPVLSTFFSANALGGGVRCDTAAPGMYISLVVRNTNDFAVVFDAVMLGRAVE